MPQLVIAFDLLPLFTRFLLTYYNFSADEYRLYLLKFFPLALVAALWITARALVRIYAGKAGQERKLPRLVLLALLGICAMLIMLTLQIVKLRYAPPFFLLTLLALGTDAAAEAARKRPVVSVLARFTAHTLLGYLALQILQFEWQWQALLFSSGLAASLAALHAAIHLAGMRAAYLRQAKRNGTAGGRAARSCSILYSLLLLLAPTLIAMLGFTRQLPVNYVLVYLILPCATPLITQARKLFDPDQDFAAFPRQNYAICLLFAALLVLIGLASRLGL